MKRQDPPPAAREPALPQERAQGGSTLPSALRATGLASNPATRRHPSTSHYRHSNR